MEGQVTEPTSRRRPRGAMQTPVVALVLTGHVSGETWQGSAAQMRRETSRACQASNEADLGGSSEARHGSAAVWQHVCEHRLADAVAARVQAELDQAEEN